MKKQFINGIAGILAAIITILSVFSVNAAVSEDEDKQYVEAYANSLYEGDQTYKIDSSERINSFTDQKDYYLFAFLPKGYAVYDKISGVVEEILLESDNPYEKADGEFYYGGPMNYFVKNDEEFYMLGDDSPLNEEDVAALTNLERLTAENRKKGIKGPPSYTDFYYMSSQSYFSSMLGDYFGCNTNGTCTQLACAILLGFYRYYVNCQFVPSGYVDGCGTTDAFHIYLQTFMGTSPSGLANAASGMNSYFSAVFFTTPTANFDCGNHNTVFSRVSYNVSQNRPTVIAMFSSYNQNCPYNHSVVAYGYREDYSGGMLASSSYYVHNGWHDNKLGVYSCDWFADDLYIY